MKTPDHHPAPAARPAALLLAVLLVSGAAAAQSPRPVAGEAEPPAAGAESAVAAPRIEVPEIEIDLGEVVRGETREARFALHNKGDATLRILRAKPG